MQAASLRLYDAPRYLSTSQQIRRRVINVIEKLNRAAPFAHTILQRVGVLTAILYKGTKFTMELYCA
jgi:hypothetical protein